MHDSPDPPNDENCSDKLKDSDHDSSTIASFGSNTTLNHSANTGQENVDQQETARASDGIDVIWTAHFLLFINY